MCAKNYDYYPSLDYALLSAEWVMSGRPNKSKEEPVEDCLLVIGISPFIEIIASKMNAVELRLEIKSLYDFCDKSSAHADKHLKVIISLVVVEEFQEVKTEKWAEKRTEQIMEILASRLHICGRGGSAHSHTHQPWINNFQTNAFRVRLKNTFPEIIKFTNKVPTHRHIRCAQMCQTAGTLPRPVHGTGPLKHLKSDDDKR